MNEVRTPVRLRLARLHGVLSAALIFGTAALALPPATVPVPGPLNPAGIFGHGAVANAYRIGTYEVTNAHYTEFLNAVADADTYALYNAAMTITRTGSAGAYQYATATPDLPVTQVSWFDALRYVNWLHNGQPAGAQGAATTESGAYILTGATTAGPRQTGARYWLPSEDEWYKAAYYSDSGSTAVYWEYPTGGMTEPVASAPTANPASANYNGIVGGVTPVASYPGSAGPYGTFDQAGNVWEWTDTVDEEERVIRGGSWKDYSLLLEAAYRDSELPSLESPFIGVRVAGAADAGTPVNRAPVAVANTYSVNQDTVLAIAAPGVLANDSDPDGNALTAVVVTGPAHGSLTLNANGSFSYTPAAAYVGSDSFTYRASDGALSSAAVTVAITVNAVNRAPVAVANTYSVNQDTVLAIAAPGVLANDSDPDGNALTAVVVTGPAHGSLTLNANGSFSYTPAAAYVGSDSFTYRASDGTLSSAAVTVAIAVNAVNHAPVAVANTYSVNQDTVLAIAAPGVLANDSDPDGNALTAVVVTGPAHGSLTLNANGSFSYTPAAAYVGSDSFTYRASDGTLSSAAVTVAITVNAVNHAPVAVANTYSVNQDTVLAIAVPGVLANDSDPDGNALTAVVVTGPAHGSLTLNANGSFSYTPAAAYVGSDSFTYRASDGTLSSAAVAVAITVNAVNRAPVAVANTYSVNQDTVLAIAAPGVLANDSDPDGNALTAVVVTGPAHGSLTLNANGSFSYTPAAAYVGSDSFTYRASDGTLSSAAVTVAITVNAVNRAPVAVANTYSVNQDTVLAIAAPGVLANDSDPDGNALTAVVVTGPAHGSLTLNANGSFSYTPAAAYVGSDSFTYRASDGTLSSAAVTVAITVNAVNTNRAPVAVANAYSVNQNTVLAIAAPGVLANDTDADGDALTAVVVTGPAHGSLTLNANGSFSYTPVTGYVGSDSFTYRASDGTLSSAAVTVAITVNAVSTGRPSLSIESATARRVGSAYEVTMTLRNRGTGAATGLTLERARLDRFEARNVTLSNIPAGGRLTTTLRLTTYRFRTLSGTQSLRLDLDYDGGSVSISRSVRIASASTEEDDD